ncbi:hypothetical protein MMC08_005165 [Hypocenomyce scalaris]|nr:hypothetical protein [Hypocenomyce scalaris]
MSSIRLLKGLSANNIIATPTRGSSRTKGRERNASPSPSPKRRRTTRADIEGKKDVDYDMKHHPMDDTMRPKAAAKRSAAGSSTPSTGDERSFKGTASSGSKNTTATPQSAGYKTSMKKTPAKKDLLTLLDKPLADSWSDLVPLDRRLFRLQGGAPSEGNTLPFKWPQVAKQLDQEGLLTRDQLKACGGFDALQERYERVRLHIQELFGAEDEPIEEKDLKVLYSEEFDVYDLVGSKAEYVPPTYRNTTAETTAKKTELRHPEGSEEDLHAEGDTTRNAAELASAVEAHTFSGSGSEESEEIGWEEQIWGPGGIRPEELDENGEYIVDENGDYIEPIEQAREDLSTSLGGVMMSQDDMSKLYEEHMHQARPTDIILSDRASTTHSDAHTTGIAEQGTQKSVPATTIDSPTGPKTSNSVAPVANMTAKISAPDVFPQGGRVTLSEMMDVGDSVEEKQTEGGADAVNKSAGQAGKDDHNSRLESSVYESREDPVLPAKNHVSIETSKPQGEPTWDDHSKTTAIDHAEQSSRGVRPSSVSVEYSQERQRKIHNFVNVVRNGPLLNISTTPEEPAWIAAATSPYGEAAASEQLLHDLEDQKSKGSPLSAATQAKPTIEDAGIKSAEASFQVFEDQAGSTPLVKKKVALQPLSPGTDIPKENFEDDSGAGDGDAMLQLMDTFGARNHNSQLRRRAAMSSESGSRHTGSDVGSPAPAALFGPFVQQAISDTLTTAATSRISNGPNLHEATVRPIAIVSAGDSIVSSETNPLETDLKDLKQARPKASDFM